MPSFFHGKIPVIRNLNDGFLRGTPDAAPSFGCVPRDFDADPVLMGDSPAGMKLVPESDWDAMFDEAEANESSLEHLFLRGDKPAFANLDQNGQGYCWAYSTGHAVMLDRLKQNLPLVRINPHATACIIKRGRDEGGWCGLSMKWAREHGYAAEGTGPGEWPKWGMSLKYDTPELRAQMGLHKSEEDWYDLGKQEWDQTLSKKQLVTSSFDNNPFPVDFNRYSHSMCGVRVVRYERGAWGIMVLNSWQGFGHHGLAVLAADIWPDNACSLRASTPSAR